MLRIIKGGKAEFSIFLYDEDDRPFDLTGFDKYKVCIPLSVSESLQITETVNSNGSQVTVPNDPILGELVVEIKGADTATLVDDDRWPIDIELDVAAVPDPIRERFDDAVQVIASTCS